LPLPAGRRWPVPRGGVAAARRPPLAAAPQRADALGAGTPPGRRALCVARPAAQPQCRCRPSPAGCRRARRPACRCAAVPLPPWIYAAAAPCRPGRRPPLWPRLSAWPLACRLACPL